METILDYNLSLLVLLMVSCKIVSPWKDTKGHDHTGVETDKSFQIAISRHTATCIKNMPTV